MASDLLHCWSRAALDLLAALLAVADEVTHEDLSDACGFPALTPANRLQENGKRLVVEWGGVDVAFSGAYR